MLGYWRPHIEFQSYLAEEIGVRWPVHRQSILAYESAIEKVWLLDLDELLSILGPTIRTSGVLRRRLRMSCGRWR